MSTSSHTNTATPTPPASGADAWLVRVQGLLAKAESTEFPEEAEALMAKAQELMTRHAIDEAMLATSGKPGADPVESAVIVVEAPYATAKASLLGAVALANNSRCVFTGTESGAKQCVVVGHASDLANIRTLYAALSLHAVRTMLVAPIPAHDTPRRFRHAFLLAFAGRIGERLREAGEAARRQAEAATGAAEASQRIGIVLADRSTAVDQAFKQEFPRVRTARPSSSSSAGRVSGRNAADRAGLGQPGLGTTRRHLRSL
ncbi:MAG: DUF2786 domain-containing protein [Aquihabitans sp.]